MEQPNYKDYVSMGKDRIQYVQEQTQGSQTPLHFINFSYPQENFIQLYGSQDKKAFKIATFRYKNTTQTPKGLIIIFHSLGLHTGTTANLAHRLANQGYVVVGFDQRGHGKSGGERGFMDDMKQILKDCTNFVRKVTDIYPNLPLFYIGHGMGSSIALVLSQQKKQFKPKGIIIANPSLKKPQSSKVISALSDFALKLMPNKAGLFAFNFRNVTKNPLASKKLVEDPLVYHDKVYVRTLQEMQEMMSIIDEKKWSKMQFPPLVIIQGQLDRVADAINSIKLYQNLPQKQKQLWYYKKLWHMLFYQEQYPQIEQRIVKWLKNRTQK